MIKEANHKSRDREFSNMYEYIEFERMVMFLKGMLPYPEQWYYKIARNRVRAIYREQIEKKYEEYRFNRAIRLHNKLMAKGELGEEVKPIFKTIDGTKYVLTDSGEYEEYIE